MLVRNGEEALQEAEVHNMQILHKMRFASMEKNARYAVHVQHVKDKADHQCDNVFSCMFGCGLAVLVGWLF